MIQIAAAGQEQTTPTSCYASLNQHNRRYSQKLNDWLQVAGMFGIIGTLVFVGVQMKQTQTFAPASSLIL
jgi:hypothetical protein